MINNSTEISKMRLASQQLNEGALTTAEEMVSWFGAVQGQEYAQTKWGLGLRLPQFSDADIENKLTDGTLLRTHLLRPTWHFVTSADIGWLLKLTAPRVNTINAFMYRKLELDAPVFKKCNKIIQKFLQGNKQLTRDEINVQFKKHKIVAEGHRLSYIMMRAELDGIICSGARRGNQIAYALLEERVKKSKTFNKEESLGELAKRYFQSRGPATVKDFSTWSGLTLTECKQGIEIIKFCLEKIVSGNNDNYFIPKPVLRKESSMIIHLLPIYDEYIMGYKDRSAILEFKNSLQPNTPISFECTIIYEGQIIGTWKRTIGNKQVDLYYHLFKPLTNKQKKEFNKAVKRFGDFNGMAVNLHETN